MFTASASMALARAHTSLAHCRAAVLWPSPGWHCAARWLASSPPVSPLAALPPRERLARLREGGAEIEPPPFLSPTAPASPPRTSCIDSEAELETLARAGAAAVSTSGPDLLDSFGRRHNYLRVSLTEVSASLSHSHSQPPRTAPHAAPRSPATLRRGATSAARIACLQRVWSCCRRSA